MPGISSLGSSCSDNLCRPHLVVMEHWAETENVYGYIDNPPECTSLQKLSFYHKTAGLEWMQSEGRGDGRGAPGRGQPSAGFPEARAWGSDHVSFPFYGRKPETLLAWSSALERSSLLLCQSPEITGEPAHPCTHSPPPRGYGVFVSLCLFLSLNPGSWGQGSRLNVRGSIWAEREDGGWGLVSLQRTRWV